MITSTDSVGVSFVVGVLSTKWRVIGRRLEKDRRLQIYRNLGDTHISTNVCLSLTNFPVGQGSGTIRTIACTLEIKGGIRMEFLRFRKPGDNAFKIPSLVINHT